MRRKQLLILACAMFLCFGCQKAEDKNEDTQEASSEQDQDKKEPDSSSEQEEGEEGYSPIVSEKDIDLDNEYPYEIRVNRAANCITIYGADDTGKYVLPVRAMICSTGGEGVPIGTFQLGETSRWQMGQDGEFCQYATNIVDDVTFHSSPYHSQNNQDLNVEQFNKMGTTVSGSSICLETADARWIAMNCPDGTKVEIYDDKKEAGPLGKPRARSIEEDAKKDPTDKGKNSKKESDYIPIKFEGIENKTINVSESFDPLDGVTAKDSKEKDLTSQIRVFGQVDSAVAGTYEITYICKNEEDEERIVKRKIQVIGLEQPESTTAPAVSITPTPAAIETPQPIVSELPSVSPTETPKPSQSSIVLESPFAAESTPVPTPTPAPSQYSSQVTAPYYDNEAPNIEIIADSMYTKDTNRATLEQRVRVTDNSGSIKNLYITVLPLSVKPYYVVIYEAEDAAGNTACISETVELTGTIVNWIQ